MLKTRVAVSDRDRGSNDSNGFCSTGSGNTASRMRGVIRFPRARSPSCRVVTEGSPVIAYTSRYESNPELSSRLRRSSQSHDGAKSRPNLSTLRNAFRRPTRVRREYVEGSTPGEPALLGGDSCVNATVVAIAQHPVALVAWLQRQEKGATCRSRSPLFLKRAASLTPACDGGRHPRGRADHPSPA